MLRNRIMLSVSPTIVKIIKLYYLNVQYFRVICKSLAWTENKFWKKVTLGHCLGNQSPSRQRKLKRCCEAASQNGVLDNLGMEHFNEVLDLLINSGLLIVMDNDLFLGESQERVLHLGVQLDDVECALEKLYLQ